ncbi:MAG: tail fiber domain-containing protein [Candidatus Paceibacterota bacterium]|jgi:hypothetical protein
MSTIFKHTKLFFKRNSILIVSLASFAIFSSGLQLLASFSPGQTLDPNCTPGSVDCTVDVSNTLSKGTSWTSRTSAADNDWNGVAYGNGLFVAVANSGIGNRVMTSPDGINWTIRTSASNNAWRDITYGNGLFVAVSQDGVGNRVMTSPDGITWTSRTSAADNQWLGVTYGNGLFVAVSFDGTGNRVMTSPDGITWTSRTSAADNNWSNITYGNGLFVAVAQTGTGDRVMTSPDGITWTSRTSAADNDWLGVTYGNGLFVAVAQTGTGNRVMTSPDGITWTSRTSAADNTWRSVVYGNGLFVGVSSTGTGNRVMTSPDGITWTIRTSAADNGWDTITYGNGMFVAVGFSGTSNRVMTSGKTDYIPFSPNNIFQGGMNINGLVGIGGSPSENLTITTSDLATNLTFGIRALTAGGASSRSIFTQNATTGALTLGVDVGLNGTAREFIINTGSTERMRIESTGFVGINVNATSQPAYPNAKYILDVAGPTILVRNSAGGRFLAEDTDVADASSPFAYFQSDGGVIKIGNANRNAGTGLTTGSVDRMTILANGNLGIGTTSPTQKLDVTGSGRFIGTGTSVLTGSIDPTASTSVVGVGTLFTTELAVGDSITVNAETRRVTVITDALNLTVDTAFTDTANDTSPDKLVPVLDIQSSMAQISTTLKVSNTSASGGNILQMDRVNNSRANAINFTTLGASDWYMGVLRNAGNPTQTFGLSFGDANLTTNGFVVNSTGKFGIGTTTPTTLLYVGNSSVSGIVATFENSTGVCTINPTTSSVGCSSDQSLKHDITTLSNSMDKIRALRGVNFKWNVDQDSDPMRIGFIAQEVQSIVPELVSDMPNGKLGVNYAGFTPLLIEGMKDLDLRLKSLETLDDGTGSSPLKKLIMDYLLNTEEKIMNGIVRVQELITNKLTVGSSSQPAGVTLFDQVTSSPYCISVANGTLTTLSGVCGTAATPSSPSIGSGSPTTPPPSDPLPSDPDPSPGGEEVPPTPSDESVTPPADIPPSEPVVE